MLIKQESSLSFPVTVSSHDFVSINATNGKGKKNATLKSNKKPISKVSSTGDHTFERYGVTASLASSPFRAESRGSPAWHANSTMQDLPCSKVRSVVAIRNRSSQLIEMKVFSCQKQTTAIIVKIPPNKVKSFELECFTQVGQSEDKIVRTTDISFRYADLKKFDITLEEDSKIFVVQKLRKNGSLKSISLPMVESDQIQKV